MATKSPRTLSGGSSPPRRSMAEAKSRKTITRKTLTAIDEASFEPQDFMFKHLRDISPDMENAAKVLQAHARGLQQRKNFRSQRFGARAANSNGPKPEFPQVTMASRRAGHPTDRQLIAQAVAHRKAQELTKNRIAESCFDEDSVLGFGEKLYDQVKETVPPPKGLEKVVMSLSQEKDQASAFSLLDEERNGVLKLPEARTFLRSMGWASSNQDLDHMLAGGVCGKPLPRNKTSPDGWTLKMLRQVMKDNIDSPNSSVEELRNALMKLANNRRLIGNSKLVEVTVANNTLLNENLKDVMAAIGAGGKFRNLDCEELARKVCMRIAQPPPIMAEYKLRGIG